MPSPTSLALRAAALSSLLLLTACPKPPGGGGPAGVKRCEVDLKASGLFSYEGTGASAKVIDSDALRIKGELSTGRNGDVLLQNDKLRVVVEQPGRSVGPILSGGHIVDADVVRGAGEQDNDRYGRMGLIYALGRISSVTDVEVLADGSAGGPAVVASTGKDVQHDLIALRALLANQAGLDIAFQVDPNKPLALRTTTYYVLSPGEARVRVLTAFCNEGTTPIVTPLVELQDVGVFGIFNPGGCNNGLGSSKLDANGCLIDASRWIGSQGPGVAYALRSFSFADPKKPVTANGALGYGGVIGTFIEGESLNGVLTWADPEARNRPGAFGLRAGETKSYLRDFLVGRDLAEISSNLLAFDGVARGSVTVAAKRADGTVAPGARVSVVDAAGTMVTLMEADATGTGRVSLPPGAYTLTPSLEGHLVGAAVPVGVTAGGSHTATVSLLEARTLTVDVADPFGAKMPAKVTVYCAGGSCPFDKDTYKQHYLLDWAGGGAAAQGYVPVSGQLTLTLPPGEYDVVVTRGPEYSAWPDTWPSSGRRVDLRTANQSVSAVLGHVVDSTGWVSADLHVHAVASTDSATGNELRVANFLAEGVDVLLSTDHEVITDFAPVIQAMGAEAFIGSMIGEEVTTFSHGHFNAFPLLRKDLPNGGAFDHAGGEDAPTLRMPQLFSGLKAEHPGAVVQLNHPRGGGGVLSLLKVDTATLATHGLPEDFMMAAAPDATAADTRLFGDGFDIIESANGPGPSFTVLNDWMTFLSRGTVRVASGVSDTHYAYSGSGGYARTWAFVGSDALAQFTPAKYAEAMRGQRAFASNGPFIRMWAKKLDGTGQPVGAEVDLGGTVSIAPAASEAVELTVDVQGPEWMQFDRVEIYSHAPGREAVNGERNDTWPEGRILDKHLLDPNNLPLAAVPGMNGLNLRKVAVQERFVVRPTKDTWYVAMVRSTAGRSMTPLHGSRPAAWTSAVLVDADGSGKYDDFPLKPGQPLKVATPERPRPPKVPTAAELEEAIRRLLDHGHE